MRTNVTPERDRSTSEPTTNRSSPLSVTTGFLVRAVPNTRLTLHDFDPDLRTIQPSDGPPKVAFELGAAVSRSRSNGTAPGLPDTQGGGPAAD
jgi:hypothetical protein